MVGVTLGRSRLCEQRIFAFFRWPYHLLLFQRLAQCCGEFRVFVGHRRQIAIYRSLYAILKRFLEAAPVWTRGPYKFREGLYVLLKNPNLMQVQDLERLSLNGCLFA